MTAISRGYRTLDRDDVVFEPWRVVVGEGVEHIEPLALEDWSYYSTIEVRAAVQVDRMSVLSSLDLPPATPVGVLCLWSSGTSLRGGTVATPLLDGSTPVSLSLDGSLLRGQLDLSCQIVVMDDVPHPLSPIAPIHAGSVVWETTTRIALEGLAPRMPILAVPFSSHLPSSRGAMWWLQVNPPEPDLEAPADGVLWMWLNSENPVIASMLARPDDLESRRTRFHIRLDLARQLVMLATRLEDLNVDVVYGEDTIGAALRRHVNLLGGDLNQLRTSARSAPEVLEARIQAAFGEGASL